MASKSRFPPEQDFPEISKHNNHMAKHLTQEIYAKMRDVETPSGFTFDECIQTGTTSSLDCIVKFNKHIKHAKFTIKCQKQLLKTLRIKFVDNNSIMKDCKFSCQYY